MKKILELLQKNKYALIWTVCYIFIVWAILKWMFNFSIFSATQWHILFHAQLRGFPGFVFGILILAAIPMYIATTNIILRTKKPLFKIPLPEFLRPVPDEKKSENAPSEKLDAPVSVQEQKQNDTPKKIIPPEMRAAFARARLHIGPTPKSNFDLSNLAQTTPSSAPKNQQEMQPVDELPLPTDFDIPEQSDNATPSFVPVFSDLNFDDQDAAQPPETPNTPNTQNTPDDLKPIVKHLEQNNIKFEIQNGIILTDRDAIAAHNDPDFWIADDGTWFAAGKQKPSPIDTILAAGAARGVRPVLYLGYTNIMDFEARRAQWSGNGVTVITDISEIQ